MDKNVTVIIPAYNESDLILNTLESLKGIERINEIIVVDDGSTDTTYQLLKPLKNITLLHIEHNKGKGNAVKHALNHVTNSIVALLDADLCSSSSEIQKLIGKIKPGEKNIIIGSLPTSKKKGGFGLVKGMSAYAFKALTLRRVDSILSGQRVLPLDFLKSIDIPDSFGLEFKITLEGVRRGYEIIEVPVNMNHRESERNLKGFVHRGKQFVDIIKIVIREIKVKKYRRY